MTANGTTGTYPVRHVWQASIRPETLLQILRQAAPSFLDSVGPEVRQFACWCARDAAGDALNGLAHRVLHSAERYALGRLSPSALRAERLSADGFAARAYATGFSRREAAAAVQLAAIRTADEDPFEAARWASHYAALAAVFREGEGGGVVVRIRQASALRFFVPNPWSPEAQHRAVA